MTFVYVRCPVLQHPARKDAAGSINRADTLDMVFEFVASMEGHDPASLDRNRFSGSGIATGSRGFGPNLKVAKARNFYVVALNKTVRHEIKKRVNHVFGFALVQPDLLKQQFGKMRLGKRGRFQTFDGKFHGRFLLHFLYLSEVSDSHARLEHGLKIGNNRLNG